MSSKRQNSPWAFDDAEIQCPKCGSKKIYRVLDRWALCRGIQTFKCSSCGRRFYDRGYDDYEPIFRT